MYCIIRASSDPMGTASLRAGDMVVIAVFGATLERRNEIKSKDINVSFCTRLDSRQTRHEEDMARHTLAAASSPHDS